MYYRGLALIIISFLILSLTGAEFVSTLTVPVIAEVIQSKPDTSAEQSAPVQTGTALNETSSDDVKITVPKIRFLAVGDIMLGRNVGKRLQSSIGGYKYAFESISELMKKGDIVFANLESPMTSNTHGLSKEKKIVLKSSPEAIDAINSAGFNLLSLSNNHMLDYYDTGLFDTMKLLDENGIAHSGAGKNMEEARKPAVIERNGLRIGLLSYSDMAQYIYSGSPSISFAAGEDKAGVAPREYDAIKEDIARIRSNVDILAVSLHWGVEESFTVTPAQIDFAHKLLDDGADIILGHHPHQFQGMEIYKGKPIFYSMGNFMFDQNDPENMEAFILDMEYTGKVLSSLSAIPVRIIEKSHVEIQTGESAQDILSREIGLCSDLGTICTAENDKLIFELK
jgi:poly-gamma-glutamate capsule biosynthesis protein CapA/YwtB (metallophosphatase superfamily)